jgi:hypothetical protein
VGAVFFAKVTDLTKTNPGRGVNFGSRMACIKEEKDVIHFFRGERLHDNGGRKKAMFLHISN